MNKMYLYWAKNFVSVVYSKLLLLFGISHTPSVIPKGEYCYSFNHKKKIVHCPYYKTLGKELNGCKYLGIITDDYIFDDMCKICDENLD